MKKIKFVLTIAFVLMMFCAVPPAFSEDSDDADDLVKRIQQCVKCCAQKKQACIYIHPDRRLCAATFEDCVDNCQKEGKGRSEWGDCWPESAEPSDPSESSEP